MSSSIALQTAIRQRLLAEPALVALLGGDKIFDDVPQAEPYPYITFGASIVDALDGTESRIDQHVLSLQVFSRSPGRRQSSEIVERIAHALDNAELPLAGHHLVSLRVTFRELRRDPDGETRRGLVRLRAITEPL
jgi:hypothetical protein